MIGDLQEDRHARSPVISPKDRLVVRRWIRIAVRPRTRVPVGAQEHAARFPGTEGGHEVRQLNGAIVAGAGLVGEGIDLHDIRSLGQLAAQIGEGSLVSLGTGRARAERALRLEVAEGALSVESRHPDATPDAFDQTERKDQNRPSKGFHSTKPGSRERSSWR